MMLDRCCLLIAAALLCAATLGCESAQHVSRGDAAMSANQPHAALASYRRAVQVDSKLYSDPVFAAKLREANWRSAFLDAEASMAAGNWAQAVGQYQATLEHNPAHPTAAQGLARAKNEGAEQGYRNALAAADRNDLKTSREELRQVLTWNPDHAAGRAAFDSLDRRGNAASEQRYAAALMRVEQRDWQTAANDFTTLINIDANHLPARAELAKAKAAMAESRVAHEQASRLLSEKRLDDAIAAGKRALDIWPTNGQAIDLLQRAQASRNRAEELFTQSKQLVSQGNYDGGIAAISQCLDLYPGHGAATQFSGQIRQTAADAHVAEARKKLNEGQIEVAASHFRTALMYVPDHRPAKDGLVDVAYSHGLGAEKEGLWGNALLWYMEATAQKPTGIYKQAEERARAAMAQRVAFDLALSVTDARGNTNADTTAMETKLVAEANRVKPAFATLIKPQDIPANNPNLPRPLFKAMMTMRSIEVRQQLVARESKQHTYNAVRSVPNPVLPELERELFRAERDLISARGRLIRYDCSDCGGRGHAVCGSCRGQKHSHCNTCSGTGKIRIQGGAWQTCNACGGRPPQLCRTCNGSGHLRCNRCGGRGFYNDHDHVLIRSREREVADLRYRLRNEPALIQQQYVVTWPYEQEIYQKTGKLDGAVRIDDAAANTTLQSFDVTPSYSKQDLVVVNANPQVGLPADGLDLPTDDAVYRGLLEDAAKNTIAGALGAAAVARANAYIAQANEHARNGKADEDIEARVAAIVLLEPTQPADAKRLLEEIRNPK